MNVFFIMKRGNGRRIFCKLEKKNKDNMVFNDYVAKYEDDESNFVFS